MLNRSRLLTLAFLGLAASAFAPSLAACSGADSSAAGSAEADQKGKKPTFPADAPCTLCVHDSDCAGGLCAQYQSDTFCAPKCGSGTACAAHEVCADVTSTHGKAEKACIPATDVCGPSPGPTPGGSGAIPSHGAVSGTVNTNGGTLSRLQFAIIGDTRPPVINDTRGYPSATIHQIYSDITALKVPFVVGSGDYLFSAGNGTQAAPQLDLYLAARAQFPGPFFPAIGNHECDGNVTSNCGAGNKNGETTNYKEYVSKLLTPIGQREPWYTIDVNAKDGSWTAKFLFVAANAWSTAQETWMKSAMAKPTTYTFIVRHEPSQANNAPGVKPSEAIMAQHPYTLAIVGHTHTYGKTGPKQVTIGNGGAPLVGGAKFGFGLVNQRADGAIEVDVVEAGTGKADTSFHFALKADGSPAP